MLQIKGLTVTHKKDLKVIIKDFSFVLNEGDKAGIDWRGRKWKIYNSEADLPGRRNRLC